MFLGRGHRDSLLLSIDRQSLVLHAVRPTVLFLVERDDLVDQLSGTIGLAGATVNRLIETDLGSSRSRNGEVRVGGVGGWLKPRLEPLQAANEPQGQTELMIVDPIVQLVCIASGPAGLADPGCQPEQEAKAAAEH